MKKGLFLGGLAAVLFFAGCFSVQHSEKQETETESVNLYFPKISASKQYLQLVLQISGASMEPIVLNYELGETEVEDTQKVPVGPSRKFTAVVLSAAGDTLFSGTISKAVAAGQVTNVHLSLKPHTGRVNICIEIPGLSDACNQEVYISGCYAVQQSNGYSGVLQISQENNILGGKADWANHADGDIHGTIQSNTFDFIIDYGGGKEGNYWGETESDGSLQGTTIFYAGPDAATWTATNTVCP